MTQALVSNRKITPRCTYLIVAVLDAFGFGGEREEVFPVEAAGTAREAGVELIEVVGTCYYEDAIVFIETLGSVGQPTGLGTGLRYREMIGYPLRPR